MNKIEKEILVEIFRFSIEPSHARNAAKFRAKRSEHLDLLDDLEKRRLIERRDNEYLLSLSSLIEIDDVHEVKDLLELCEKIFLHLRKFYIDNTGEKITINELSKETSISRLDLERAFHYIVQTDIMGGHSAHFYNVEDAWCVPSEYILRKKSFRDLIRKIPDKVDDLYVGGIPYAFSGESGLLDNSPVSYGFISFSKIEKFKKINNEEFDFSRLIRIFEEINYNFRAKNYLATGALLRILLDHIPPLLGFSTFKEIASNYSAKSLKGTFQHLENGCRNISDGILHQSIRRKESLPTLHQVNYASDIDALLGEIIRKLEESKK